MLSKKECVVYSVFIYLVLILVAFLVRDKKHFISRDLCHNQSPCARFCCENTRTCNDEFIRKHFNESLVLESWKLYHHDEAPGPSNKVKIFYGKPNCKLELIGEDKKWQFTPTGLIWVSNSIIEHDDYCLRDEKFAGNIEWSLYVCSMYKYHVQRNLHYVLLAIASLFLAAIILVYTSFDESLRSENHGKISHVLFIGLFISVTLIPFIREREDENMFMLSKLCVFFFGLLLALTCLNVLCFDIWWTLRKVNTSTDGNERFKFYKYYVIGIITTAVLITFFEKLVTSVSLDILPYLVAALFFFLTTLSDFAFLAMTGINILRTKISSKNHAWFHQEKKRFWMYVQLFLIVMIAGVANVYSFFRRNESYECKMAIDILTCYSAVLLVGIFIFNEKTREIVFKRYSVLNIK